MEISHGFLKNYTGSASMINGSKNITVTINGPSENATREESFDKMAIEIKFRLFPSDKSFENMISGLLLKILDKFVTRDIERNRGISINVISNNKDIATNINCVLVALLDSGVPLNNMFYACGQDDVCAIFENDIPVFCHSYRDIADIEIDNLKKILPYIKESIRFAFRDVFDIS